MAIQVLLADDHRMFRQGIRYYIKNSKEARKADIEVVGEAGDGKEACRLVKELNPDVVVMDVHMPRQDGVRATRAIMDFNNPPAIVMLTMSKQDDYVFEAIKAGARGYYLKDANVSELITAIQLAAEGEMILSPELAKRVLKEFRKMAQTGVKTGLSSLADREIDILRQVAGGNTNQQIANNLGLSEKTIKNQLSGVFNKLRIKNRTQAAIYALRHGLVRLEEL
jgi:DNA-binding NarL/FixJ family response regulator